MEILPIIWGFILHYEKILINKLRTVNRVFEFYEFKFSHLFTIFKKIKALVNKYHDINKSIFKSKMRDLKFLENPKIPDFLKKFIN